MLRLGPRPSCPRLVDHSGAAHATLEIELAPGAVADDVRRAVKGRVRETTGTEHVTVEVAAGVERRRG